MDPFGRGLGVELVLATEEVEDIGICIGKLDCPVGLEGGQAEADRI